MTRLFAHPLFSAGAAEPVRRLREYTSALVKSLPDQAVFVDPSGRRRRLARRAGVVVAVPAVGYVLLLVSTMLGGPSVSTPLVPIPDAVRPPAARHTVAPKSDTGATPTPSTSTNSAPSDEPTRSPSATPGPGNGTVAPVGSSSSPPPSGTPATTVPSSTPPTAVPTPTHPTQANNTTKPGRTNSPTARPAHTPKNPKTP